ncbi:DUF397 domain-containing protein [Streptomyces akebiae]|uniref:DUF397 domain-containing protein n=1 Tax=Streptomyces akebiae TaxID=2865673 RepID=A0ABX8XUK0_9ACTN|nr:DUF397 domain-containing protein [Streptomyces akebiae]QYX79219.1 DUF397 domain-containing protein [Streptomyces akebiae]
MRNISDHELGNAIWHKSSYSEGGGGNCLEVTLSSSPHIPVRDSKNPLGPKLVFRAESWSLFIEDLKRA